LTPSGKEPGIFVTLDETRDEVLHSISNFKWDFEKFEQEKKLTVIAYIRSFLHELEGTLDYRYSREEQDQVYKYFSVGMLFEKIQQACNEINAKRIVIDPLNSLTFMAASQALARCGIMLLMEKLKSLNVTTIITVEEDSEYWRDAAILSGGVIHLRFEEKESVFNRGIVVKKMRATDHDQAAHPFKITDDGIKVFTNELYYK